MTNLEKEIPSECPDPTLKSIEYCVGLKNNPVCLRCPLGPSRMWQEGKAVGTNEKAIGQFLKAIAEVVRTSDNPHQVIEVAKTTLEEVLKPKAD